MRIARGTRSVCRIYERNRERERDWEGGGVGVERQVEGGIEVEKNVRK